MLVLALRQYPDVTAGCLIVSTESKLDLHISRVRGKLEPPSLWNQSQCPLKPLWHRGKVLLVKGFRGRGAPPSHHSYTFAAALSDDGAAAVAAPAAESV